MINDKNTKKYDFIPTLKRKEVMTIMEEIEKLEHEIMLIYEKGLPYSDDDSERLQTLTELIFDLYEDLGHEMRK